MTIQQLIDKWEHEADVIRFQAMDEKNKLMWVVLVEKWQLINKCIGELKSLQNDI